MSVPDAIIVLSDQSPEPARAAWIVKELSKQGLTAELLKYKGSDNVLATLEKAKQRVQAVIALFSDSTANKIGMAWVEMWNKSEKVMPVRSENCRMPELMADITTADIFDVDEAKDREQLVKLAMSIRVYSQA